jgi:hypothetical protein
MENLSHYQERVLDKLLPTHEKTIPYDELVRISELYYTIFKDEKDEYLLYRFRKQIESNLSFVINQDYKYQELTEYKKDYLLRIKDYIEDHDHISTWNRNGDNKKLIKELTIDYLEECISEQNRIIDKTIKYMVPVPDRDSLNVMQFVSDEFLDEYKRSSKRKINFLNEELNQLKGISKPIEAVETPITEVSEVEKKDSNPYPLLFISSDTYHKFIEYISKHIQDFYKDYSYLKKRLEFERLIHNQTDTEFMRILHEELKLITEEEFEDYFEKGKLSSLGKSKAKERTSNFNKIFINI